MCENFGNSGGVRGVNFEGRFWKIQRGGGSHGKYLLWGWLWLFSGTTQLQKELSIAFYPDLHVFVFFEIAEVYSRLAGCRVYEGHLQNERVIKTFQKHPKSSKFVCIDSSLQFTFL